MRKGRLTVIAGCMSSGKSTELMRLLRRAEIADRRVIEFVPAIDHRSGAAIASRDGGTRLAQAVADPRDIPAKADPRKYQVVGLDEMQFFPPTIVPVVNELLDRGQEVIGAGLDTDFRGEPFGVMPFLLALADARPHVDAVCVVCKGPATRSQRLIDGRPARWDDSVIHVGGDECYEARCRDCHEVPR